MSTIPSLGTRPKPGAEFPPAGNLAGRNFKQPHNISANGQFQGLDIPMPPPSDPHSDLQPDLQSVTSAPDALPFWRSILFKQLALYLLLILLMSGIIGYFFLVTARQHLEVEVGRKLQYIARISARTVPLERLELIRVGADSSRMVLRLKEKLQQIRQEASGIRNIYAFRPDMRSLVDLVPNTPIGSLYNLPGLDPTAMRHLEKGHSVHTKGYPTPDGLQVSAYAPVQGLDGQLFAVVGVDAGGGELALIDRLSNRLYWLVGAGVGLAIALALVFARIITRPVRQIAQTAERLGRGDYQARATVNSGDEVGVLAAAVNRMAEQVRLRDTALKEMAAGVAHEIRNPLNSLKLLIDLLDAETSHNRGPTQANTVKTLHYEIGKLNRFIGQFLAYARPEAIERQEVRADALVSSVIDMATAEAQSHQVEVTACIESGLPDLEVDRLRLEQTLLNLVLNAIQASPRASRVQIGASPNPDGGIEVWVEDNGEGIPSEALPRLFEPFFTTKAEGTGLGLANARKTAEEHRGHLKAENRPQGGARFVLYLPAACRQKGGK
jgi:signal transduction histidine kinase